MTITVSQKWTGSRVSDDRVSSQYIVTGTDDEFVARENLNAATAAEVFGLPKQSAEITGRLSESAWEGEVVWGKRQSRDSIMQGNGGFGESVASSYQFEIGGGSTKLMQSLATTRYAPPGKTAPDFKGAIGVTEQGVEGVEIAVPLHKWSETHQFPAEIVDAAYRKRIGELVGTINVATFRGYEPGEVLLEGVSGAQRTGELWEITFRFARSPNREDLTVGDITVLVKHGWSYLWVRYEEVVDDTAKAIVKKPVAAYVETVYYADDFADLKIGTDPL